MSAGHRETHSSDIDSADASSSLHYSLLDDVRHLVNILEQLVRDLRVLEVRLQTECELEQPGPLRLHGGQVGLHRLRGRVVLRHQSSALLLDRVELTLSSLQFAHHVLRKKEEEVEW